MPEPRERAIIRFAFGEWRSPASALQWGCRGPGFKSPLPDLGRYTRKMDECSVFMLGEWIKFLEPIDVTAKALQEVIFSSNNQTTPAG